MSKRIANCRGRKTAHFKTIRYGWRPKKAAVDLDTINRKLEEGGLSEEITARYENFKQGALRILPKKLLQRHQDR